MLRSPIRQFRLQALSGDIEPVGGETPPLSNRLDAQESHFQ
jgi:hypothetical protein